MEHSFISQNVYFASVMSPSCLRLMFIPLQHNASVTQEFYFHSVDMSMSKQKQEIQEIKIKLKYVKFNFIFKVTWTHNNACQWITPASIFTMDDDSLILEVQKHNLINETKYIHFTRP